MVRIDALGPGGEYRTRKPELVFDTAGTPVAELSVVPRLFVTRALAAQRKVRPLPAAQRVAALDKAAELFRTATIAGLDFDTYVELTQRVSGLPRSVARAGAHVVADSLATTLDAVEPARPAGTVADWRDSPAAGGAVWARRGEVLAVHAPGNAPGVHGLWPQALALGYRVAVRPSRREPFTAHRLVHALRQAGFRNEDATYLPTDYEGADEIIRAADLSLVYGGQDVADRYAADQTVLVNGPGRTKIIVTAEQDWRDYLDELVDSISNLGGMACVNATAVLYEGDPTQLADAIAVRLAALPPDTLPTAPVADARALADHLAAKAAGTVAVLGADQVVADRGDGRAALRPAVHRLTTLDIDTINTELPFPCVWVAPWTRADGIPPLRNSLVVNAITRDEDLIDALVDEPSVVNLYVGRQVTHHGAAQLPHEGFLADFLMRNKAFIPWPPRGRL
ncbi:MULTISPECIES: aldehyde dehydrogenase family protein [unclassified Mycobacterium]|uniref:aldehyde dehydrogenase family protein n=1 Tax=unclassified Mycobacterium TaxID=2642494 RepID=UPI0029C86F80|nr:MULTISPECIES: aldehyde dehydrogenase family protein [unclassified Mycobacterium]